MWEEDYFKLSVEASRQQGIVTSAQAGKVGVGETAIAHLQDVGLLGKLDWDVFQLAGSSLGPMYAYPYAAWLAISPELFRWERPSRPSEDATLSHGSACRLHGLAPVNAPSLVFTAPAGRTAPRATTIHVAPLADDEVIVVRGIPVTTPHRTILDMLTDRVEHADIQRALTTAVQRDLVDLRAIYTDLAALAEQYEFPRTGPEFAHYFLPDLDPRSLSLRNLRSYSALLLPGRVAEVRHKIVPILTDAGLAERPDSSGEEDGELSLEIAAEIAARVQWNA